MCVVDNGIGIPPEYHKEVFGMFERLHSVSEYPGTGIGLAIVQKAVARMNGRVSLESAPGAGSRFCIELKKAGKIEHHEGQPRIGGSGRNANRAFQVCKCSGSG